MTPSSVLTWLVANRTELLVDAGLVVAGASVFIKALEVLVALLTGLFPGLAVVDGKLKGLAAVLDRVATWPLLHKVALSPKPRALSSGGTSSGDGDGLAQALGAAGSVTRGSGSTLSRTYGMRQLERGKLLGLLLVVGLVALPAGARADKLDWAAGPTIPLIRYDLASPVPVQVAAGAGLQLSLTLDSLKRDVLGRSWDLASLNGMAFGSLITPAGAQQFGALSAAVGVCLFSSVVCVDYGHDVLTSNQALAKGPGFLLLAFSFNVALEPVAPSAFDKASWKLPRGNTLYFAGGQ